MNDQGREALEAYYAEAASWNRDRLEGLRSSRRVAWRVAAGAAAIAICEAIALMVLTPLKTVVPYTLLVDRTTGYVQALNPVNPEKIAPDAALTQSMLVQYVIARESFDIDTVRTNYNRVALWSGERARSDYLGLMQASNPQSPLSAYPRSTTVTTVVKSVSSLAPNVALVRFDTVRQDSNGQAEPPRSWVSVIRYRFSGEPMKLEDRFINPLGFHVLRYRRDAEAAPMNGQNAVAPIMQPAPVVVPGNSGVTVVTPGGSTTTIGPAPSRPGPAASTPLQRGVPVRQGAGQ